jgi:hypothetical protein
LLNENNAVSAAEKKAENPTRNARVTNWETEAASMAGFNLQLRRVVND